MKEILAFFQSIFISVCDSSSPLTLPPPSVSGQRHGPEASLLFELFRFHLCILIDLICLNTSSERRRVGDVGDDSILVPSNVNDVD